MIGNRDWKLTSTSAKLRRVPRKVRELIVDLENAGFLRVHGDKGATGNSDTRNFRDSSWFQVTRATMPNIIRKNKFAMRSGASSGHESAR
jgi:hypothetical protein